MNTPNERDQNQEPEKLPDTVENLTEGDEETGPLPPTPPPPPPKPGN